VSAGPRFISGLRTTGLSLVFVGLVSALLPHTVGTLFGRYVLGMDPLIVLGACAGAGTITAALRDIQDEARSNVPALGYTVPYAIGNILLTPWGPVLVALRWIGKRASPDSARAGQSMTPVLAHEAELEFELGGPEYRGTVRDDYSESGDAWNYFSHDRACSRAYRWGSTPLSMLLCRRLLGQLVSESGTSCHGDGGHEGGDRHPRCSCCLRHVG